MMPRKTLLAIATFVALLAALQLARVPLFDWRTIPALLGIEPGVEAPAPAAVLIPKAPARPPAAPIAAAHVEDPHGALAPFFFALERTEAGGQDPVTRILHYGDSPTTADMITADARAALQKRYGDGGHGFTLPAKPWAWYDHRGLDIESSGWEPGIAGEGEVRDGRFGLGGVSFVASEGAWSRITLRDASHTHVEAAFLRQPGGGTFQLLAGGALLATVDTQAPQPVNDFIRLPLPEGARQIELRVDKAPVRLFGLDLQKPGPGLRYSSLGMNGAYISLLARIFDQQHWAEQLRHYQPDLVIVNYGTNETVSEDFLATIYARELRAAIRRLREAVPDCALLVMSPMDRGQLEPGGQIVTVPALPRLVDIQRRVALASRCAFFNTYAAMGGESTMARWYASDPRLVSADFIHPTPAGARIVGNLLVKALVEGYNLYRERRAKPGS